MNDIVKYHNDMNKISFTGFNEKELNVFFTLILLAKEQGIRDLTIPFSDLKILSKNDARRSNKRFIETLKVLNKKLLTLNWEAQSGSTTYLFTLFNIFAIDIEKEILTVKVNEIFSYILNDFVGNFTIFELSTYVKLRSSYSKHMYRLLKQWESKKEKEFSLDELRELLGVPTTYNNSQFNEKVLKPIREELTEILPHFTIDKKKNGRKIIGYMFTWKQKQLEVEIPEDKIVEISTELTKAFEKAAKNRFIQPFLTNKGKSELIDTFENEEALIRGLYYAYKTIKKEFKNLLYLTKVIATGAEEQKVVIKTAKKDNYDIDIEDIKNNNIRQTSFDELPKEKKKIEVTEKEFEVLYKKFLEENNAPDSPFTRKSFSIPYSIKKENAEEK
uniref:Initiator Rep protein WH1 domain-containing protein n=1 Tax=uncultured prokaryote TaxID=198431 RepID=A0A0H5Q0V0_9ZZZZ|nr:hypothetical protein [uncultured prokaryote]